MAEFIIATPSAEIGQLKEELAALSVSENLAKKAIELTVSNSTSTQNLWFLPQDFEGASPDRGPAFIGLASLTSQDLENAAPAIIESEDNTLILSADF